MNVRENIRKLTIYKSLIRNNMVLGGERELALTVILSSVLIAILLIMSSGLFIALVVGFLYWSCGVFVVREMGKKDPIFSKIIRRNKNYRFFYPAKGSIGNEIAKFKPYR